MSLEYILKEIYSLSATQFSSKIQVVISAKILMQHLYSFTTRPWKLLKKTYSSVIKNTFAKNLVVKNSSSDLETIAFKQHCILFIDRTFP